MTSRVKKPLSSAIFGSSSEESGNESEGSDYNPSDEEIKPKRQKKEPKPKSPNSKKLKEQKELKAQKPKESKPKVKSEKQAPKRKAKDDILDTSENKKTKVENGEPKKKKAVVSPKITNINPHWTPGEVIARENHIDRGTADTVVRLLEDGNSLPFLARYRREATGGMGPDQLRKVKDQLDSLTEVRDKCVKFVNSLDKVGKLTPVLKTSLMRAQSLPELEHVYAPYKTGSKATLAERARKLGLEDVAVEILEGKNHSWDFSRLVCKGVKGKESVDEVKTGIQNIIADLIVHDPDTVDFLRDLQSRTALMIESKKAKVAKSDAKDEKKKAKEEDISKFENYFEFSKPAKYIQPHQVLALNRGENLKVLSVKVNIPDWFLHQLQGHVSRRWRLQQGSQRMSIVAASLDDAYKRLVTPLVQRQTRTLLTKNAEEASISVFLENLRRLLLVPPYRGRPLLSIDPGFRNGCKVAVLSAQGSLLEHAVIHPNFSRSGDTSQPAARKVQELVTRHSVATIAIGNGTACREVETLVSSILSLPGMSLNYCIVEEQGASIYSCSPLAQQEFPGLDTNIVSAVSIGRRLQDPLSELVKIEPQHLGVGMYQHDIQQAKLKTALDEVVVECVSFVGVDVNTCSPHLLNRVAGLKLNTAKAIVEWREKNGDFLSREQLKDVKGIGDKVFQQCAGFVRVTSSQGKKVKNMLDMTQIHPESYCVAKKLMAKAELKSENIGSEQFITALKRFTSKCLSLEKVAEDLTIGVPTLEFILSALEQSLEYDFRAEFSAPLFKSGMLKLEDAKRGDVLTGRVGNVTHFGAFVDVGLGKSGLVHVSKMKGHKLELGQRIEVKIESIDLNRGRIGLELIRLL